VPAVTVEYDVTDAKPETAKKADETASDTQGTTTTNDVTKVADETTVAKLNESAPTATVGANNVGIIATIITALLAVIALIAHRISKANEGETN
jgi:hypothetical protein